MHIEVKQSTVDNKWYWHFLSKGRITAQGESHPSKGNAVRAAKAVVRAIVARDYEAAFVAGMLEGRAAQLGRSP